MLILFVKKNIKLSFLLVFLMLLSAVVYFGIRLWLLQNNKTLFKTDETRALSSLRQYKNSLTGISIQIPKDLMERDLGEGAIYYDFVRFEEVTVGKDKGVALGIRESSLQDEVERIKKDFETQGDALLVEQKNTKVNGYKAVNLTYKPKQKKDGEDRTIVIFTKDKFTYSISTVPSQIDKIIKSVKFL